MQRGGVEDPQRTRRRAGSAIAAAGAMNLLSALTPPVWSRLHEVLSWFPLAVSQTATALVVATGVALLLLARGIRRGQRHAWVLATLVLGVSSVLHIVKGLDVEEAVVAIGVTWYLIAHHDAFTVPADDGAVRWGAAALVLAAVAAVIDVHIGAAGGVAVWLVITAAVVAAVAAGWILFRPVRHARHVGGARLSAEEIVRRHGGDTLAYFALREDKCHFTWGETLVAYAVIGGVCLVSPDPIGPSCERALAWEAFCRFAGDHGWDVAVLGAGEGWLPVYRAAGLRAVYVGDEAIVDVQGFCLDGGRMKGLRQAVNRVARHGYRVEFFDPASIDGDLRAQLLAVMTKSRRGQAERGFSMTLGRVFEPRDRGLLLAVAFDADDRPVAFCQYVPAASVDGFSLDLMRRDDGDHPNGVIDFVIVRTIEHLRSLGYAGLGLNFATLRGVLAGERGNGVGQRTGQWALTRLSGSLQIESLWRFTAKYDPAWLARYAVFAGPEQVLPTALAIARAESFSELPLVGRFLTA